MASHVRRDGRWRWSLYWSWRTASMVAEALGGSTLVVDEVVDSEYG